MDKNIFESFERELHQLKKQGNIRELPLIKHQGKTVQYKEHQMLNLSSNDYLGIATDIPLREELLQMISSKNALFSSSSSRLLTGNHSIYTKLENQLCQMFNSESALVFNSGYHMNIGILPAVCNSNTLILADKLVHASIIDGIRLSKSKFIRYRHADYEQLNRLIETHTDSFERIIIVTESIFSMDGDSTDLRRLIRLKRKYPNVLLYVDEAHAIGVRGNRGLGCAEEQNCISEIDFLTGTFGKALASVGGYIICSKLIRDYLINKMRPLLFTTALPPINLMWTLFVLERLNNFQDRRKHLMECSALLRTQLIEKGFKHLSESHIVPLIIGDSKNALSKAKYLWRKGFYMLPIRPPTVPEGTSRIRISLTANITKEDIYKIVDSI